MILICEHQLENFVHILGSAQEWWRTPPNKFYTALYHIVGAYAPQRILVDITDQCWLSRDAKVFCSDDKCACDAQITEVNFPVDYRFLLLIREELWWKVANGFTGVSQILGSEIDKARSPLPRKPALLERWRILLRYSGSLELRERMM